LQRFCDKNKRETDNFLGTQLESSNHYRTIRLEELVCRYARDTCYSQAVKVVEDVSGEYQLSDQKISEIVKEKAKEKSVEKTLQVRKILNENTLPAINTNVDIYSATTKETILEIDGIVVKEQKEKRDKKAKEHKSFVNNTIALLENKSHRFDCLIGGLNEEDGSHASLKEVIQSKIIENYKDQLQPLNMVAINDGAKDIRNLLMSVFGATIFVILDWFHLKKKVNEYMSMFGLPCEEKKEHIKEILHFLWRDEVENAIEKLNKIEIKKTEKRDDLIGYFEKHQLEIINYEKRQKAGKMIGSGLIENGVNQIVGKRQKNKGMSWRPKGSKAIAILKSTEYNNEWDDLWLLKQVA